MELLLGLLCALAGLHGAGAETVYGTWGGRLTLRPHPPPGPAGIQGLLWKFGPDKAAEWHEAFQTPTEYFSVFEGHATMNLSTGELLLTGLKSEHIGQYSVELNHERQSRTYDVTLIDRVLRAVVSLSPLACGPHLSSCLLSCTGGTTTTGPLQYSWRTDEGPWAAFQEDRLPNISNSEAMWDVETLSCNLTNPVSWRQSEPVKNPFYHPDVPPSSGSGWIAAVIVVLILVLCGGIVAYLKRDAIRSFVRQRMGRRTNEEDPASGPAPGHASNGGQPGSETVPFKAGDSS